MRRDNHRSFHLSNNNHRFIHPWKKQSPFFAALNRTLAVFFSSEANSHRSFQLWEEQPPFLSSLKKTISIFSHLKITIAVSFKSEWNNRRFCSATVVFSSEKTITNISTLKNNCRRSFHFWMEQPSFCSAMNESISILKKTVDVQLSYKKNSYRSLHF